MVRIVDLSVTIENNMPAHKNMPRPVYLEWMTRDSARVALGVPGDPFTTPIEYVGMLNRVGTHVDAFFHLKPGGLTIDEMPLELFMANAVCFDPTHIPDLGDIDVAEFPSHRACRDRGMTHVEWLCNLEELVGVREFRFQAVPLKFSRGSGSPVRALAFVD
jgi:kynurenine formamidase